VATTPPGWHPDPFGRSALRYWDGARWTEHVSTSGRTAVDHVPEPDRSVLTEPALVFEYDSPQTGNGWYVWDAAGRSVARVTGTTGFQGLGPLHHRLVDPRGIPLLAVAEGGPTRPGLHVSDAFGRALGTVRGWGTNERSRFDLLVGDAPVGVVEVATTRYTIDATITDTDERQVAVLSKGIERVDALRHRSWLSLTRDPELTDPLRLLVVATPLAVHMDLFRRSVGDTGHDRWDPL
jgi:Protein of unknown function (DUF2510)